MERKLNICERLSVYFTGFLLTMSPGPGVCVFFDLLIIICRTNLTYVTVTIGSGESASPASVSGRHLLVAD